ncbi:hypothetical protein FKM82_006567 [Ascaphus truei]
MASLMLKRALFSITKPLSFLGQHAAKHSSISAFFCGRMQYTIPWNVMGSGRGPFLASNHLPTIQQTSGMKTKSAVRKRCKDCFIVKRRGRVFVYCKTNGKHKQRQG